jgi:conjugative relaxase-like TrwC/TraI family protein
MLTVQKLHAVRATAVAEYFTDVEAQRNTGDYYAGKDGTPVECPGTWLGSLAERFGAHGDVTVEQLLHLLDGRHPITGERLVPFRKDRVAAHDITFSAPKSVSAVWALAADRLRDEVHQAQEQAVAEAVRYVERHVPLVRRGRNGTIVETASEVLAVAFTHHTSRQTENQADHDLPPDPQVHTHVLLPMARRHDGEIVAINSAALFRGRREVEAVYHASLADRLAEMGFEIRRGTGRGERYFEIEGIPEALCAEWSSRHQEIEDHSGAQVAEFRAKYGRDPSLVELRDLAARSRIPKGRSYPEPATYWREIGAAHGVTADTIEATLRPGGRPAAADRTAQLIAEVLGEDGLTREHAALDLRTVMTGAMQQATGLIGVDDTTRMLAELVGRGDLVPVNNGAWTTKEMLTLERDVLAWRDRRCALSPPPAPTNEQVWTAIRMQQQRRDISLSGEQLEAFRAMLRDGFTAITGEAGVGKGVVLAAAANVWRSQERRVFAIAVAGATAQRLAADMGNGAQAMTLDGLVTRLTHGRLTLRPDDVIALDEAGMVDTRRWAKFTAAVGDSAQVVAVGDAAQLSPLSAGGLWPMLAANGPRLSGIRRTALGWERKAWQHLRSGDAAAALAAYAEHGHLSVSATRSDAVAAAVAQWDADGRGGLLITDASNAERHEANIEAQQRRITARELGAVALTVSTGDGSVGLRTGDRVIFRRQCRIGGTERRVENGTTGQVVGVDVDRRVITVRTNEAQPRDLEVPATEAGMIDLHYATHIYKGQGATVDRTYVITGGWQVDREKLYVACSRSRHGTFVYVDRESLGRITDVAALATMAQRGAQSRAKVAASALHSPAPGHQSRRTARKRPRRMLTSRRPLVETYQRRQRLRWARYEGRQCREREMFLHRARVRHMKSSHIQKPAAVPEWVVTAFEAVTRSRYGLR